MKILNVTKPVPIKLVHNQITNPPVLVVMPPPTEFQIHYHTDKNHSDVFVKTNISTIKAPKNVNLVTLLVKLVTVPLNTIVKFVPQNTKKMTKEDVEKILYVILVVMLVTEQNNPNVFLATKIEHL